MTPKHAASLAAAFLVGAGATVSLGQGAHAAPPPPNPEVLHWLGVFGDVLDTAEREHIEPVDSPKAIQAALEGLMQSLDPHSSYITPEEFAALIGKGPASASVGLNLSNDRQGAVIVSVLPNSPASRGDVQRGDHILAIDGTSAADTLDRVVHRLRGPVGSPITLTLGRGDRQVTVTLIRDHVAAAPAVTSRMIGTQGYVSVVRLDDKTADEVAKAIRTFKAAQPAMTGLVLDLRDCPGGLFGEAVGISDIFLEGGVIVSQRGRDPKDVERYMAHMGDELRGAPMAVLVNGTTASGCEIIAGALQDRGRARVVGMPTFGLGAIQTVIPVHGGKDGAMKLTTSMVYLPSGRMLQKTGIAPDVLVARDAAEAEFGIATYRWREASLKGAIDPTPPPAPIAPMQPELPPTGTPKSEDFQLTRALAELTAKRR